MITLWRCQGAVQMWCVVPVISAPYSHRLSGGACHNCLDCHASTGLFCLKVPIVVLGEAQCLHHVVQVSTLCVFLLKVLL